MLDSDSEDEKTEETKEQPPPEEQSQAPNKTLDSTLTRMMSRRLWKRSTRRKRVDGGFAARVEKAKISSDSENEGKFKLSYYDVINIFKEGEKSTSPVGSPKAPGSPKQVDSPKAADSPKEDESSKEVSSPQTADSPKAVDSLKEPEAAAEEEEEEEDVPRPRKPADFSSSESEEDEYVDTRFVWWISFFSLFLTLSGTPAPIFTCKTLRLTSLCVCVW